MVEAAQSNIFERFSKHARSSIPNSKRVRQGTGRKKWPSRLRNCLPARIEEGCPIRCFAVNDWYVHHRRRKPAALRAGRGGSDPDLGGGRPRQWQHHRQGGRWRVEAFAHLPRVCRSVLQHAARTCGRRRPSPLGNRYPSAFPSQTELWGGTHQSRHSGSTYVVAGRVDPFLPRFVAVLLLPLFPGRFDLQRYWIQSIGESARRRLFHKQITSFDRDLGGRGRAVARDGVRSAQGDVWYISQFDVVSHSKRS